MSTQFGLALLSAVTGQYRDSVRYLTFAALSLSQEHTFFLYATQPLLGGADRLPLANQDCFFYRFHASFSDVELKPGTLSTHLIFGSYGGTFYIDIC